MSDDDESSFKPMIDAVMNVVNQYISRKYESIIGTEESSDCWIITVEVLERKMVPDTQDLLGRYEIKLSKHAKVMGWKQIMVRRRCDPYIQEK
jgi:hypothetical protein